jgi:protein transport protein SEC20
VERSSFAQEIFQQSNEALKQLSTQYNNLDSLLSSSKNLLSTLLTSQKSDTWYLETTFYILVVTIGWLVFRRLLYGPFWWLVWLPMKLLYRLVFMVFGILGIFDKAAVANSTSVSLSSGQPVISSSSAFTMSSAQPIEGKGGNGKPAEDPSPEGSESQKVGKMAEDSRKAEYAPGTVRGDGVPLVESDEPRNPKKRMWVEDPAPTKEKDEL